MDESLKSDIRAIARKTMLKLMVMVSSFSFFSTTSLDPTKLTKRGNPKYVGKMTSYTPGTFLVTLKNRRQVVGLLLNCGIVIEISIKHPHH